MDEQQIRKDLAQKMNIDGLPQEEQDAVLGELMEALMQRVMFETAAKLSEADQDTYLEKLEDESTTPQQMEEFLRGAIAEYEQFLASTVDQFFKDFEDFEKQLVSPEGSEHATQEADKANTGEQPIEQPIKQPDAPQASDHSTPVTPS